MTNKKVLNSLEDTESFAKGFAKDLLASMEQEPKTIVVFMQGGLGAGKTTFTRYLGQALGIEEKITSPTFVGLNEYYSGKVTFLHMDLYQVKFSDSELRELISSDEAKVIVMEWSENLDPDSSFTKSLQADSNAQLIQIKLETQDDSRLLVLS